MVAAGSFRADLYYRLHVLPIRLPALRERLADIEALAEALLDDIARRSGLAHKGLSSAALDRLAAHHWPGNIRELRNVLEQAALMTDGLVLDVSDMAAALGDALPMSGRPPPPAVPVRRQLPHPVRSIQPLPLPAQPLVPRLPQAVAELEQRAIAQALLATGGNKHAAAQLLGIARATLYQKLAQAPDPAKG